MHNLFPFFVSGLPEKTLNPITDRKAHNVSSFPHASTFDVLIKSQIYWFTERESEFLSPSSSSSFYTRRGYCGWNLKSLARPWSKWRILWGMLSSFDDSTHTARVASSSSSSNSIRQQQNRKYLWTSKPFIFITLCCLYFNVVGMRHTFRLT